MRAGPKDIQISQPHDDGRGTPLPQYEKTQSVPFTLTLQEEKDNPGQFQLVVNVDPKHQEVKGGTSPQPAVSKKLIASLKAVPSLGYDVSSLYHTRESSPPSSPNDEKQGWSDLDAIPPEFLNKVVPDWNVTFSRSDSTVSTQSRKLADIKARIKKSGKGFVVRLLKGSNADPETDDVAEVHLGSKGNADEGKRANPETQELAADALPVELDASTGAPANVFEIGTSNEPGISRVEPPTAAAHLPAVNQWLHQISDPPRRSSILEEGLSDAETLLPDVRSIADRLEDTDIEPFSSNSSVMLGRSGSTLSIIKTPTRGLSVVGPVKRVQKAPRTKSKGKAARSNLNRSGANRSFRRSTLSHIESLSENTPASTTKRTPEPSAAHSPSTSRQNTVHFSSEDNSIWQDASSAQSSIKPLARRRSSTEQASQGKNTRSQLRLETDVPRASSANTSPVLRRKRKTRAKKQTSLSSSVDITRSSDQVQDVSPVWSEVDTSDELRAALDKAFGNVAGGVSPETSESMPVPRIEEPIPEPDIGGILPHDVETRMPPPRKRNPTTIFFTLAVSALVDGATRGLTNLRDKYGSEPPVQPKHVRVRWTCVS